MNLDTLNANRDALHACWMITVAAALAAGETSADLYCVGPILARDGSLSLRVTRFGTYTYDLRIDPAGNLFEDYRDATLPV